jgi:hypothetical protein
VIARIALATTASPAGLLVLEADGRASAGLSAEAVVWMADARAPGEDTEGDVLVIAVRAQTRSGRAGVRLGRFVSTLDALRPVHIDGAAVRIRLPRRLDVEIAGGIPVVPDGSRSAVPCGISAATAARTRRDPAIHARSCRRRGRVGWCGRCTSMARGRSRPIHLEAT